MIGFGGVNGVIYWVTEAISTQEIMEAVKALMNRKVLGLDKVTSDIV